MKKFILPFILIVALMGCATTGEVVTDTAQHEAQMRTIGRGIGAALIIAAPNSIPGAKAFCEEFSAVEDALEAGNLVAVALNYFLAGHVESPALTYAVIDALAAIGITDAAIGEILDLESVTAENLPIMEGEAIDNVKLIMTGFCSMISLPL